VPTKCSSPSGPSARRCWPACTRCRSPCCRARSTPAHRRIEPRRSRAAHPAITGQGEFGRDHCLFPRRDAEPDFLHRLVVGVVEQAPCCRSVGKAEHDRAVRRFTSAGSTSKPATRTSAPCFLRNGLSPGRYSLRHRSMSRWGAQEILHNIPQSVTRVEHAVMADTGKADQPSMASHGFRQLVCHPGPGECIL
jgi:hypothetical protein